MTKKQLTFEERCKKLEKELASCRKTNRILVKHCERLRYYAIAYTGGMRS